MSNPQPDSPVVEESAIETPLQAEEEGTHHYDERFLRRVLEGTLLAAGEALSLDRMLTLFDEDKRPSKTQLQETLNTIADGQHDRGFVLREVASGWRFEVCDDLAPWVNRLWEEKPQKYSRALLETLALIAYRQPLTRGDIEDVRGVAVSSHIIKTLAEREWVKVVGHRDVPGRPALYATTRHFLDYFGLKSLEDLPSLGELKDIDSLSKSLDFAHCANNEADDDEASNDNAQNDNDINEAASADDVAYLDGQSDQANSLGGQTSNEEVHADESILDDKTIDAFAELDACVESLEADVEVVDSDAERVDSDAERVDSNAQAVAFCETEVAAENPASAMNNGSVNKEPSGNETTKLP